MFFFSFSWSFNALICWSALVYSFNASISPLSSYFFLASFLCLRRLRYALFLSSKGFKSFALFPKSSGEDANEDNFDSKYFSSLALFFSSFAVSFLAFLLFFSFWFKAFNAWSALVYLFIASFLSSSDSAWLKSNEAFLRSFNNDNFCRLRSSNSFLPPLPFNLFANSFNSISSKVVFGAGKARTFCPALPIILLKESLLNA